MCDQCVCVCVCVNVRLNVHVCVCLSQCVRLVMRCAIVSYVGIYIYLVH